MNATTQRQEALDRANEVRRMRANSKSETRKLDSSYAAVLVQMVLTDPPDWATTWRLVEVLGTIRGMGKVRITRLMIRLGLPDRMELGKMTDRQRKAVCDWLDERYGT